MVHGFSSQLPWYVVGPAIGLLLVTLFAIANKPLGASGAYVQVLFFWQHRADTEVWRCCYYVGIITGAALLALLRPGSTLSLHYGALGQALPLPMLALVLFGAGAAMGYGARWAGGCTSGHGLCGTSQLSPASFVVTIAFFGTAVGVTLLLHALTGGAL